VLVPTRIGDLNATSTNGTGALGGAQIGYNWQNGRFVFGPEGDLAAADIRSRCTVNPVDPFGRFGGN